MLEKSAQRIGWQAASKRGAVAAGGADAVAAGIEILEQDGNAADAAAGTILALNVTDHGACSIGHGTPPWDGFGSGCLPRALHSIQARVVVS